MSNLHVNPKLLHYRIGKGMTEYEGTWGWAICPGCLWLGPYPGIDLYKKFDKAPSCPRDTDDTHGVFTMFLKSRYERLGRTCIEGAVWLNDLAPKVVEAAEALCRLKGPNAVLELFHGLEAVEVGIDDPKGKPHQFYFSDHRPNSVKDEDRDLPSKLIGKRYGVKRES